MAQVGLVPASIAPVSPAARGYAPAPAPVPAFGQDAFVRTPAPAPTYGYPAYPAASGVPAAAESPAHARRDAWFIAQNGGWSNPLEDVAGNQNCGPACVAMIAKAFGRVGAGPASADAVVEATRSMMGATPDELQPTDTSQLVAGAANYGLPARHLVGADLAALQAELAAGRLPIACVAPRYFDPAASGGHFTVVTAIRGGMVYLNDPGNPAGPMAIPVQQFQACWQEKFGHLVSVGA